MTMKKFAAVVASAALAVLAAGCSDTTTNTNTNANGNRNTATVLNNNGNANTAGITTNANANVNANANTNANANLSRADYEKDRTRYDKEARDAAKSAGRTIGQGAEDAWLWTKTRTALAAADDLRDSTINVDVENGVITLTGNVSSNDQVKKADSIAKGIEGKKSVQNRLKVAAGGANTNANGNRNGNANAKKG